MLPPLDTATGYLPLGRHPATMQEIEARFRDAPEYATSATRADVWAHFQTATDGLRRVVPVCAVWVSGSFLSTKLDPDDMDVIYWCEDRHLDAIPQTDVARRLLLEQFSTNQIRAMTGLRVDTRYGRWHARPEPWLTNDVADRGYVQARGFWDDFWQRVRSGAKNDPPVRADALPRRGYLEVILDGFDAV